MKRNVTILLCALFALCIFVSGYQLYRIRNEYQSGENAYDDLQEQVTTPSVTPEGEQASQSDTTEAKMNFAPLQNINSDIIGWLKIEACGIDYPIARGTDNSYYLKHLYDKTYNSSGCLFLDYRNNAAFSDPNSVVFGHHMKNGTMFSGLGKYKSQEFYEAHPSYALYTPDTNYTVDIFAGYVAGLDDDAWRLAFDGQTDMESWLNERIAKSLIRCSTAPDPDDKIITLSTCSYEFNNARFVLFGVLREGNR